MSQIFDSDELRRRVDEVLFYVWDPIGVAPEPCARWEYKEYVPGVLSQVIGHDRPEPIAEYLAALSGDNMALAPDLQKCATAAELLLEHKRAVAQGLA